MSQVQTDLALSGELMDDLGLKFRVVDPGLSEGSGVAILLPVVMPVPMLVSTITKHWHLEPNSVGAAKMKRRTFTTKWVFNTQAIDRTT